MAPRSHRMENMLALASVAVGLALIWALALYAMQAGSAGQAAVPLLLAGALSVLAIVIVVLVIVRFRRLSEREQRVAHLLETTADLVWTTNAEHQLVEVHALHEACPKLAPGQPLWIAARTGMGEEIRSQMRAHAGLDGVVLEAPRENAPPQRWALHGQPIFDAWGRFAGYLGALREIPDDDNLLDSTWHLQSLVQPAPPTGLDINARDFMATVIEQLPVGVFVKDVKDDFRFVVWNQAMERMFLKRRDQALGGVDRDIMPAAEANEFLEVQRRVVEAGCVLDLPVQRLTTLRGDMYAQVRLVPLLDEDDHSSWLLGIIDDVSERHQAEMRIERMAHYDALTGLPNRALLHDRLYHDIEVARRRHEALAVMFLDLDNFKTVNDTLGHEVGDQLLQAVAGRLTASLRKADTVARLGGDEFIVLAPALKDPRFASAVADKLIRALSAPFILGGQELHMTPSIGISMFPGDGENPATLIKHADTAMYQCKSGGRNGYQYFERSMNVRAMEMLTIGNEIRRALERDEFVLHYQPQVDLTTGQIIGAEALLRWQHPEHGLVYPGRFIHVAEDTGLIVPIGEWTLRAACMQAHRWQVAGLTPMPVAVNLSGRQFQQNLPEQVKRTLHEVGLEARYLELELTESVLLPNTEEEIRALSELGTIISVDDFGTGYSNLSYLKRFQIDKLKIDQSFVRDLNNDPDDAAIVAAIIGMAKSLKLKVIAEGVETREQVDFLRSRGCDEIQGYYFCKPVPAEAFAELLRLDQRLS